MKKTIISAAIMLAALAGFAQDTTKVTIETSSDTSNSQKTDTIKIGGMIIIKKGDYPGDSKKNVEWHHKKKNSRLQTSWLLVDLGFSNFEDKTLYGSPAMNTYTGNKPFNANDFTIRNGKSFNINVWLFRQRYGITKDNVFNLTYGLMVETNNYRYENNISYLKGGPPFIIKDTLDFEKNKLAMSYFTVPVMLGFNTNPKSKHGFNASAGVSIGYLYSSRNKQISDERGKQKIKGNFNLEPWKIALVGEVGVGVLKVYGSYSPTSMYKNGLDMRPYSIGLRLGGWD
ncbi:MAG: outer membrane beta-barrel protein [Bacteroidota bacterium]